MLYTATGGAEGVGGVNDLKVLPLSIPGQGVRVAVGTGLMLSQYVSAKNESYQGAVSTQRTVSTTPATAKRSDLIVMQVEDPWADNSPWPAPAAGTEETYDAFPIRVIQNVPAGTKRLQDIAGYSSRTAITLARIDFPANTGTVTASMIVDLRDVAIPRRTEVVFARPRVAADDTTQRFLTALTSNGGEYFPGGGGAPNEFQVDIPKWATRMVIDARWMTVTYKNNPFGSFWVEYGDEYRNHTWPNKQQWEFATQLFGFNAPNTGADEKTDQWALMDEVPIPAKLRGKTVTFVFKAGVSTAAMGTGKWVWMNATGGLGMRITMAERAIDSDLL